MTAEEIENELVSSGKAIENCGIICNPRLKAELAYGFYKDGINIPIISNPCVESNKFYVVTDTELVNKMKEMVEQ